MIYPTQKLGDVCRTYSGGTPSRARLNYFGGGVPWVTITDMLQGIVIATKETLSNEGVANSSAKLLPVGTILISIFATIGRTAVLGVEATTNQAIAGVVPNDPSQLDPRYLKYFLDSMHSFLNSEARGVAQPNINQGILRALEVPLPPLAEQHRIVDLLSRAEGIVRLRREAQQKTAELIPAIFLEMFGDPATNPKGWPIVSLGQALSAADYGSSTKASDDGQGLPLIRMGNVGFDGNLDLSKLKFVQLDNAAVEKYALRKGDILFNRTNSKDLVGKTGMWNDSMHAVVASYFIRLRVNPELLAPTYLWVFMNGRHMKRVLFDTARGAIGQANINSKELTAFRIALPPLSLQKAFEQYVESVQSVRAQQASASAKAETNFDAMLSRAFSI